MTSPQIRSCEPQKIAPDTHVLRHITGEGTGPVAVYINSMVITGSEPVIVDTGPAVARQTWLEQAFSVVDPEDVRWVFLSHDDVDHTGNLYEVLDRCPKATLVTNWFSVERMASDGALPLDRMRWVNDGERFTAGDHELVAVVPPTFDSPTTRGLYDVSTGVYWASDSIGTPVTHHVDNVDDLPPGFWDEASLMQERMLSPWHQWLDPIRYEAHLERVRNLEARVVATAHGPALFGTQVEQALERLSRLPHMETVTLPDQAVLEGILAQITGAAAA